MSLEQRQILQKYGFPLCTYAPCNPGVVLWPLSQVFSLFSYGGLISLFSPLIDQNNNEPLFEENGKIQCEEEGVCKDKDAAQRIKAATENKEESGNHKLICSNDQEKWQLKIEINNKVGNEKTHEHEALGDTASGNEGKVEGSLVRNVSSLTSLEAPKDQPGISANIEEVATAIRMDIQDGTAPQKLLSNIKSFKESSNTVQNRVMNREISKDSTDSLTMGLESAAEQKEGEPPLTSQDLGVGDSTETGENVQMLNTENKKKNLTDVSGGIVKSTSHKVKRVRFNLEGNETSSNQPPNSTEEIGKEEAKMMFSDEEDEENKDRSIDEDVSQRISRIHNLLRSDRLRTNRKRKYPVV